jgi:hypothetical protein
METVETVQSAFLHYTSISMSLHTPQQLFKIVIMEDCFGGNVIQNGKTVILSLCTYWIVLLKKKRERHHSTAIMQDLKRNHSIHEHFAFYEDNLTGKGMFLS